MSSSHNNHKIAKIIFGSFLVIANVVFWLNFTNSYAQKIQTEISEQIKSIENALPVQTYKYEPKTKGLLMFRGSPYRNFYGTGPLPKTEPVVLWRYPNQNVSPNKPLCSVSYVHGIGKTWCGSGWTGQPIVWEHDGITEIITNAYDRGIHFINANDGTQVRKPFYTGDIIKGTVTMDPDNYPLLYSGSRDNFYRIIALDREVPTELWKIEAKQSEGVWNNDWDSNGIIIKDVLYTGSENGWFHAIKLNRGYDTNGKVTVNPTEIFKYPTFGDNYIQTVGDEDLSIESSPLLVGNTIYIANSGGRILGFNIEKINEGIIPVVFDFWTGDDTDATLVADDEKNIYAVTEYERMNEREKLLGQIMKLDPKKYTNGGDPFVWGIPVPSRVNGVPGGVWATPAIKNDRLYVATNPGDVLIVDTKNGKVLDKKYIGENAWSSPTLIDNSLIVASCRGIVYNFNISKDKLETIWQKQIPGGSCIESTPAIWNGQLFFGSRDGYIYSIK